MTKEFKLSDKMSNTTFSSDGMFFKRDIKEFIKRLKDTRICDCGCCQRNALLLNKIAGSQLIDNSLSGTKDTPEGTLPKVVTTSGISKGCGKMDLSIGTFCGTSVENGESIEPKKDFPMRLCPSCQDDVPLSMEEFNESVGEMLKQKNDTCICGLKEYNHLNEIGHRTDRGIYCDDTRTKKFEVRK